MEKKLYTLSLLVNNKPDVLSRVAGMLGGRGYNIENLCVNITLNPEISKIVLTTLGNKTTVTKIEKQLNRLVDVHQVSNLTENDDVEREMALIRMNVTKGNKSKIKKAANALKCRIVAMEPDYCILEVTGEPGEIKNALTHLEPMGIEDIARTGTVALARKK